MSKILIDGEGENRAVRAFLALYGAGVTVESMRRHLKSAGFDGAWPDWANNHAGHLTKAGAQIWIRHLFALAKQPAPAAPVQQEPEMVAAFRSSYAYTVGVQDGKAQAQPAREPLTDEEMAKAWAVADGEHNASSTVKRRITRAIEAAHGITKGNT